MKASLQSARIAPKKANIVAAMIRGLTVEEALTQLSRTNKKAARFLEKLIASAAANAVHNDKQSRGQLMIQSLVVNQGMGYRRGVPMARGRMRPMRKFMSHITLTLGLLTDEKRTMPKKGGGKKGAKARAKASQGAAAPVEGKPSKRTSKTTTTSKTSKKDESSKSSISSKSSSSSQ